MEEGVTKAPADDSILAWMNRVHQRGVKPGVGGGDPPTEWFWTRKGAGALGGMRYSLSKFIFDLLSQGQKKGNSRAYASESEAWTDLVHAVCKAVTRRAVLSRLIDKSADLPDGSSDTP